MNSIELARWMRRNEIEMVHRTHASHVASMLSVTDILAVLYADILKYDAARPNWEDRDRLVLSKGHAGVAVYCALAACGFFPVERLNTYYQDGSFLSGHVSHKNVPGVEFSTGSLGHGVVVAAGMALAAKQQKKAHHIYAIVGDGECEEGMVWEAALIAAHQKLDNFTVIIDRNKMQAMGDCEEVAGLGSLKEKWESFGWNVIVVPDGNDHVQLREVLPTAVKDKPTCVIANTIKGKGVSFMENNLLWHYRDPQGEYYDRAMMELKENAEYCSTPN